VEKKVNKVYRVFRVQLGLWEKGENPDNRENRVLLGQKATEEKRVIKAIREKLVRLVLWALKVPKGSKAYPVKTELLVKLDLKAPWVQKVRVEKKEKKVIEDLWALKVLLGQEERLAQLDLLDKTDNHL
jgi:hypothetical protein